MWLLAFSEKYLFSFINYNNVTILISTLGCLLIIISLFHKYFNVAVQMEDDASQFCDSPSCLRCNKNSILIHNAKDIFLLDVKEKAGLQRVSNAIIGDDCDTVNSTGVYLLYVAGLTSHSTWSFEDLPESYKLDYNILKENIDVFIKDFNKLPSVFTINGWSKYFLRNQGRLIDENYTFCTGTSSILEKCTNIMTDCVFGYIFFSILHPNSSIADHNGPTNCRIRCHISLQVPQETEECEMDVAGTKIHWPEKGLVIFDDSLKHSVKYIDKQKDCIDRVVLLIDFWHPELTLTERKCIQKCFNPLKKV